MSSSSRAARGSRQLLVRGSWSGRRLPLGLLCSLGYTVTRVLSASSHVRPPSHLSLRPGDAQEDHEQTILFVRHGEGWHNKHAVELPNWHSDGLGLRPEYRDAELTPEGERQCAALAARLRAQAAAPPDLVVVSTLSRAIQTATLSFVDADAPFVATELARERIASHECDHRSPLSDLRAKFSHVDFGEVSDEDDVLWWDRKEVEPHELNATRCSERAVDLLEWLLNRPEKRIAVVTHWVFLKHLFALFPTTTSDLQANFKNAEMRVVSLSQNNNNGGSSSLSSASSSVSASAANDCPAES